MEPRRSRKKGACSEKVQCASTAQGTLKTPGIPQFENMRLQGRPLRRAFHRIVQHEVILDEEAVAAACPYSV